MQSDINNLKQTNEDLEAEVVRLNEEIITMIKTDITERADEKVKHEELIELKKELIKDYESELKQLLNEGVEDAA